MPRILLLIVFVVACSPNRRDPGNGDGDGGGSNTCPSCTADKTAVVDCDGNATQCPLEQSCNDGMCLNSCQAAEQNHESVGCDYYAVDMDAAQGPPSDACYTVFVANTSRGQVHMTVEWN